MTTHKTKDYDFSRTTEKVARDVFLAAIAALIYFYGSQIAGLGAYPFLKAGYDYVKHGTDLPTFSKIREVFGRE
jgi:hypothetical protein